MTGWTLAVNLVWAGVVVYLFTYQPKGLKKLWELIRTRDWKFQAGGMKIESLQSQRAPDSPITIPEQSNKIYTPISYQSEHAKKLGAEIDRALLRLPDDKVKESLVVVLSNTLFRENCEGIYNRIFESQVLALEELEKIKSISRNEAIQEWKAYVALNPGLYREEDFDAWAQYLLNTNLVMFEAGRYSITQDGFDFLRYIKNTKLPRNRPI